MIKRKCLKEEARILWNERLEERRLQILKKRSLIKEQLLEEIRSSGEDVSMMMTDSIKKHKSLDKTMTKFVKKNNLLPLMQEEYLIPNDVSGGSDEQILKSVFNQNKLDEKDWYLLYRPQGKRVLVISNSVHTFIVEMRAKENKLFLKKYVSVLQSIEGKKQSFTILDGILYESDKEKKVYILDLIAWNGRFFNTNPAEFRFYWLKQKWREDLQDNTKTLDGNVLEMELCERTTLSNFFEKNYIAPEYTPDGLLLYHKEGEYVQETSPFLLVLRTVNNCSYLREMMESGIFTFKMLYEKQDSCAKLKIGNLEIRVGLISHLTSNSVVKVKLRLKHERLEDEINPECLEILSIEEDLFTRLLGKEDMLDCCDPFGKLLFYFSIQNLQNDRMIL